MSFPELSVTQFGFDYGPARVERLFSDDKWGVVVRVASVQEPAKYVDVRISPKGKSVQVTQP